MKAKVIAYYLPQFHAIPENDEWWGKGFTDWVNVKKAKPLFKRHQQPKCPLNNNYYDLSDPETLRWQAELAKEYSVYGFCFYHYWFNGKLLLEKPAELLLANKDIDVNFCFSWANEPWARTWDGKAHQVLMPQNYGSKDDWKAHFNYLLPFFKDKRYIKEDNRPMLLIYKSTSIPCAKEMMDCWNELARKEGFDGIHFVETLRGQELDKRPLPFLAKVEFEPVRSNLHQPWIVLNYKRIRRIVIGAINAVFHLSIPQNSPFRFEDVAKRSIALESPEGTYGGIFTGWDNTPRRGAISTIVLPPTKEELKNYLISKIRQTQSHYHTNYIFVNAWNEWAEGAVLEPDTIHHYQYLETVKEVIDEL
ncbi:MAG: glycoside hydrolase family 99-like domain-containing protein [Bacteroidaceae bacterium]|nr:glycoside hydrolase family 99-like domain-containing protein [Bacteroidaceae bacterium]